MSIVHFNCLIIRRSTNTNSFGLRGIWVITEHSRLVFEFAANDLDAKAYQVGEFVRVPFRLPAKESAELAHPAHELARQIGTSPVPIKDVPGFLGLFNDTLADQWIAYRNSKAIKAHPLPEGTQALKTAVAEKHRIKLTAQDNPDHSPLNAGNLRAIGN